MPGPEIRRGSAFEIRLDHGRRDVRLAADRRRVAEAVGHGAHHGHDGALPVAVPVPLREGDRRQERAAPRPEVLRAELVAEMRLHVLVQRPAREVAHAAVPLVAEEASSPGNCKKLANRRRELVVDERGAYLRPALADEFEADAMPAHGHVPLPQRRDSEGAGCARVPIASDAKPAEVDEAQRDGAHPVAVELAVVEMLGQRRPQGRQPLAETNEALEFGPVLFRPEIGVIDVLLAAGLVDAGCLELRARPRCDPDVLPRRRDREPVEALDRRRVADCIPAPVEIAKRSLASDPTRHLEGGTGLHWPPMRDENVIVVLEGDQTGQELLEESLRVFAPDVIGIELEFPRYDLSLEARRESGNGVVHEAAEAIREHGLGLKAATVTPEGRDDVGSPNRILREEIGGKVIVRTGRRIPGVVPLGGVFAPISIVRMAVGDAYGAKEWREGEGDDEVAFRTERIERRVCHAVAEFAFRQAERSGAKIFGGPKYTVSPTYEGMLKEEMDAAAERHPDVPYEPQLIDATFALLLSTTGEPLVIPALNRDGDILSDLVLPLFGSIAGSESLLVAFEDDFEPAAIMAEAAHGTAPSLEGKNVANPMAMILGGAALLSHAGEAGQRAGRAVREACLEAVGSGARTADLGGELGTSEFTDEVISRVRAKLEVWSTI